MAVELDHGAEPWVTGHWTEIGDEDRRREILDAFERVLTGRAYDDPALPGSTLDLDYVIDLRDEGLDWPMTACTMVGSKRLRNFRELIEAAITEDIPGDIVETGVWRGGASMLARAVLATHGVTDRQVVLADSFAGLPPPDPRFPADAGSQLHERPELAIPLEVVRTNFAAAGLLDPQVRFVPGWFKDTMPTFEIDRIAVLRLDGDLYESTLEPLEHLYDRVSPGGWVIVDDYYMLTCCQIAVADFFATRGEQPELDRIDLVGAYLRKPFEG